MVGFFFWLDFFLLDFFRFCFGGIGYEAGLVGFLGVGFFLGWIIFGRIIFGWIFWIFLVGYDIRQGWLDCLDNTSAVKVRCTLGNLLTDISFFFVLGFQIPPISI